LTKLLIDSLEFSAIAQQHSRAIEGRLLNAQKAVLWCAQQIITTACMYSFVAPGAAQELPARLCLLG
jgi:hypothetical protein